MGRSVDIPREHRHRLTSADLHRLAESGAFAPEERVELIGGGLVDRTPIGSRHAEVVRNLTNLLAGKIGPGLLVDGQNLLHLSEEDEPQPDPALVYRREASYGRALPTGEDALLVVEVADTSLPFDREVKLPLYARSGIPEAWLVDLEGERIEVHTAPAAAEYGGVERFRRKMVLRSPGLDVEVAVDAILPAA
ncbi:Uma2 family endonuclease [Thiohalorhabdus sp.]|uniref:Uma2 family endonuclease n=1 Tax=Thiohalorhabdus sp. TaxID=3094134 RepID=UPI002FC33B45